MGLQLQQLLLLLLIIINYKEYQFVNIVNSHESTQPNMNLIITTATKITEELGQPSENSDAKQDGIQHAKARLEESPKNGKTK